MSDAAENLEDDGGGEEFAWPDGWQEQIAGDDEKQLAHLSKYKSPEDIWVKARSLEQKLSSGEYKQTTPFPTDGSDEEKAAWRQEQGLPSEAGKYELSREISEDDDKEAIDAFLGYAFEKNLNPQHVNDMVDYFYSRAEEQATNLAEGDQMQQQVTDDALRVEWGTDYRGNINRIDNLIATAPADVAEILLEARLPNGNLLKADADAMRFLFDMAKLADPVTTVTDAKGSGQLSAIEDEIDAIKKVMREDRKSYNNDAKMQARYRQLLEAQQKLQPQQ